MGFVSMEMFASLREGFQHHFCNTVTSCSALHHVSATNNLPLSFSATRFLKQSTKEEHLVKRKANSLLYL